MARRLSSLTIAISPSTLLRMVTLGFALLVLLVLAAGYVGYTGSRRIQWNAQQMVREHLLEDARASELETEIEQESGHLIHELGILLGVCGVLAAGCMAVTLTVISRTQQRLEWQAEELNRVSWHMLEDQEKVARRFSHEMHDELGQTLTGLKGMVKRWSPAEFQSGRQELVDMLEEVLRGVRELSQLLRPVILDDFGLDAGLRWLCGRFSERTAIEIEYESNFTGRLSDQLETHLFRITQEALTNIARHSGASRAHVRLHASDSEIILSIADNGRGITQADLAGRPSLGMVGMRARARHVEGRLTLGNGDGGGLTIRIQAPIRLPLENGDSELQ